MASSGSPGIPASQDQSTFQAASWEHLDRRDEVRRCREQSLVALKRYLWCFEKRSLADSHECAHASEPGLLGPSADCTQERAFPSEIFREHHTQLTSCPSGRSVSQASWPWAAFARGQNAAKRCFQLLHVSRSAHSCYSCHAITLPSRSTRVSNTVWCPVRRAKASVFSGCESRLATIAPASSNRSSRGGNEAAEASGVEGRKATWRACRP